MHVESVDGQQVLRKGPRDVRGNAMTSAELRVYTYANIPVSTAMTPQDSRLET